MAVVLVAGMSMAGATAWGNPITAFEPNPGAIPFPPGTDPGETGHAQASFLAELTSFTILDFTGLEGGFFFNNSPSSWPVAGIGTFSVDPTSDALGFVTSYNLSGSGWGGFGTTSVSQDDPFLEANSHGSGGTGSPIPPYMFEFTFDPALGAVNAFGFYVVDAGDQNERLIVQLLDNGVVFDQLTLDHETGVDGNASIFFWGYIAPRSFTSFRVLTQGENPLNRINDIYGFDDFIFGLGEVAIPTPGTLALFGAGLLGMAAVRRRKSNGPPVRRG